MAQIVLDGTQLIAPGTDLDTINLHDPGSRARHSVLIGVLAHETGHADHTHSRRGEPAHIATWSALLEEPCMESQVARDNPAARLWMQAAVAHIIGDPTPTTADDAARALILIGGRLLGGVLDEHTAPDLDQVLADVLTEHQIAVIAEATAQAVDLADGDLDGLARCAARIAKVLGTADAGPDCRMNSELGHADRTGTPGPGQTPPPAPITSADRDTATGAASTAGDRTADELGQALQSIAVAAATSMAASAGILAPTPEANEKAAVAKRHSRQVSVDTVAARNVKHSTTPRRATPNELEQSKQLNKALAAAAYRGLDKTQVASSTPPGAMRTAELVRRSAQRAAGATVTARPWERNYRRERPQPALTIGIAVDISPSQDQVTEPAAVAAWLLTRAAHDTAGHTATVTWHSTAALLPDAGAGSTIHVPSTGGLSHGLPAALRTLDGCLRLTATRNVRLAVIITDGELPNPEEVNMEVAHLIKGGVNVLWLNSRPWSGNSMAPPPGVIAADLHDPHRLSRIIAEAAITALRAAH